MDLGRVGQDGTGSRADVMPDLDRAGDRGPEHLDGLLDQMAYDDGLQLLIGVTAERQDLPDQILGAQSCLVHLLEVGLDIGQLFRLQHRHLGKPDHDGQDVVEIVGNPPGQGAHGFHPLQLAKAPLALPKGLFGPLALGDIPGENQGSIRSFKSKRNSRDLDADGSTIDPQICPFNHRYGISLVDELDPFSKRGVFIRGNTLRDLPANQLVGGCGAEQAYRGMIQVNEKPVSRPHEDGIRRAFHDHAKTLLALLELFLHALALGDVKKREDDVRFIIDLNQLCGMIA